MKNILLSFSLYLQNINNSHKISFQITVQIFDVLTSEFGAWSMPEVQGHALFYKLDRWEDMHRRRYRTIKNPYGTSHPEATLRPGSAEGMFIIYHCLIILCFGRLLSHRITEAIGSIG